MSHACREYVERHLERSFYNHAALTPADWETYCRLAALARERFGLHVAAPALPEHKLTEGRSPTSLFNFLCLVSAL